MVEQAVKYIAAEEYLENERRASQKHEYNNGETFVMPGVTIRHNTIQMNFYGEVREFLKGKSCKVYSSDLRVHIPSKNSFSYPDAFIVCEKPQMLDKELHTILIINSQDKIN